MKLRKRITNVRGAQRAVAQQEHLEPGASDGLSFWKAPAYGADWKADFWAKPAGRSLGWLLRSVQRNAEKISNMQFLGQMCSEFLEKNQLQKSLLKLKSEGS